MKRRTIRNWRIERDERGNGFLLKGFDAAQHTLVVTTYYASMLGSLVWTDDSRAPDRAPVWTADGLMYVEGPGELLFDRVVP
jgi:hypothetical protein